MKTEPCYYKIEYIPSPILYSLDCLHYGNRYMISQRGKLYDNKLKRFKSNKSESNGYVTTSLTSENNISTTYGVHRLVALQFIPNLEDKPIVNHKDRIRNNNKINNLEWVTHSENAIHGNQYEGLNRSNYTNKSFNKRTKTFGSVTDVQSIEIKTKIRQGVTLEQICIDYNLHLSVLNRILKGRAIDNRSI